MKFYEMLGQSAPFLMPKLPAIVRLDGKAFHSFTKGLKRPFDATFHALMCEVTKVLVEETGALMGYTQSDEISLMLYQTEPKTQFYCGGRVFKIIATLSSKATLVFNQLLPKYLTGKPQFVAQMDCRVFSVPTKEEAINAFLWRELDASKNSVSMAARAYLSHSALQGKDGREMKQMLKAEKGVIWDDYPASFKRGTYFRREKVVGKFSKSELEELPPKHAARTNPNLEVVRSVIKTLDLPPLVKYVGAAVDIFFP